MKIIAENEICKTDWVTLKTKTFLDRDGIEKEWGFIERIRKGRAAAIIPVTKETGSIILIEQFRVPLGKKIIEFPAGLIDEGETPTQTAIRELKEETGFVGEVTNVSPEVCSSPGLTSETIYMINMKVEEEARYEQELETSELIEVIKVKPEDAKKMVALWIKENILIDTKVYIYLMGL